MTRKRKSMINSRLAIAIAALVVGVGSIWIILVFFGPVVDTGFGSDFWRFAPPPLQVSVHATVIWPSTGVKVQLDPFATIDRARLMSTVSRVVVPDRTSNGVTAFTSPEGTLNTTVVPSSILPVAAMTTSRISVYLPGPTRALASSSDTFTRDARSIDV